MSTIIDEMEQVKLAAESQRNSLQRTYRTILHRFNNAEPGDGTKLIAVMHQLGIGEEQMKSDLAVIESAKQHEGQIREVSEKDHLEYKQKTAKAITAAKALLIGGLTQALEQLSVSELIDEIGGMQRNSNRLRTRPGISGSFGEAMAMITIAGDPADVERKNNMHEAAVARLKKSHPLLFE